MKCPNSHLAMESLTAPKTEVWWLTPYESESDRQRVANGYATNRELMDALRQIPKRKQDIVEAPIDILANYRRDLSGKASWKIGGSRYFVVTIMKESPWAQGAVFEAKDGMRFVLRPAATLPQSVGLAAAAGPAATIFAIRLLGNASKGLDCCRPGVLEGEPNGTIQVDNRWTLRVILKVCRVISEN